MKKRLGAAINRQLLPAVAFMSLTAAIATAGFATVRFATNNLLEKEARNDAANWSSYLSLNISDLPGIAEGAMPSPATQTFLRNASRMSRVYSFRIYDGKGLLKLRSDGADRPTGIVPTMAATDGEHSPVLSGGEPKTLVRRGKAPGEPAYYASTVLPIMDGKRRVGWIVTNTDQTERQANFFAMASSVSLIIGSMLMMAPLVGLWYRTRQKRLAEQQLQDLSTRDQLTGLLNRHSFVEEATSLLTSPDAGGKRAAMIMLELADINSISQMYGQAALDHQLLTTAERLAGALPAGTRVGRTDAARFAVLLDNIADPMTVLSLTKEIFAKLGTPVAWNDKHIATAVHAGIALSKSDGEDVEGLLRSAGLALRTAQEQGSPGYGFFNPEIAQDARRRVAVQRAVAEAAASNGFRLDFQPIYNMRNGELTGFEALIRLNDPELGNVSPAEFIPLAEQSGHINKIGAWCLQEACKAAAQWPAHLVVAVNLSPAQFYSGTLIGDVQQALRNNRFPSYRLEVEITEGTLLKDSELVLQQLHTLRESGVTVALDDFGTGYSSLSYLWKFPFSKLKIDRSFVSALDETQRARGILRSIIKLGHGLGLSVTAEGIENAKQYSTLRDLGCDLAQGYLLDRPARVEDLAAIIMRNFSKGLQRRPRESRAAVAEVIPLRSSQAG